MAGGEELSVLPGERSVVHAELHLQGRGVDRHKRQTFLFLGLTQGFADKHVFEAGDSHDFTCFCIFNFVQPHTGEPVQFHHGSAFLFASMTPAADGFAFADSSLAHASNGNPADVGVPVQITDQHAERGLRKGGGSRDGFQNHVEQRVQVVLRILQIFHHKSVPCAAVEEGGVELFFAGIQFEQH